MLPILEISDVGGGINVAISNPPIAVSILRVPIDSLSMNTSPGDSSESCEPGDYMVIAIDRSGPGPDFPAVARLVTVSST